MKLFEKQSNDYKENIFPSSVKKRVSVEAGVTLGWERYTGLEGLNIGTNNFGASAPAEVVAEKFGVDEPGIYKAVSDYLKRS